MGFFDLLKKKRPPKVTMTLSGGEVLTRSETFGCFEGEILWQGRRCDLTLSPDQKGADSAGAAAAHFARLREQEAELNEVFFARTADDLTGLASDWEGRTVSREEFLSRIRLVAIQVQPEGDYEIWFDGDEMFADHSIVLYGSVETGPNDADIVG